MQAISRISLIQYGFMALPLAFAGLPLYIHMPALYTETFAVDIGILGILLLGIRLFDAVQDPFIGYVSDTHPHHRLQIVIGGMAVLTLGLGGLSIGPLLSIPPLIWFGICMVCATSGFSIVSININTIGGLWHTNATGYTRISAWREAFGLVGLICASILPTLLQQYISVLDAFMVSFIVFVILSSIATIGYIHIMKIISIYKKNKNPQTDIKRPLLNITHIFDHIFDRGNRVFFGICLLSYLSAGLPAVLVLFFIEYYLQATPYTGIFLLLYFVSGAMFMGAWIRISQKYGALTTWQIAMIVSVVTFFSAIFLQTGDIVFYGIICVASGIALGADIALPPAIIANRIKNTHTQSHATQYYAVLAFLSKIALALSAGVAFVMLDTAGFETTVPIPTTAAETLLWLYAGIPCGIRLMAVIAIFIFKKIEGNYA